MKQEIKRDILILIKKLFVKNQSSELYIRIGKFWLFFINEFPLKYQKEDKYLVTPSYLLSIVKEMGIASPFKFKRRRPKRYKFVRRRFENVNLSN
jgi:hypothetical protein